MRRPACGFALISAAIAFIASIGDARVAACTAFCAAAGDTVLVGNNEDSDNPRTKIWFVPAANGEFGRVYTGFDDLTPQGGMNERGLWFDGFAAPPIGPSGPSAELPSYRGNIVDAAMAQCSTVEEVVRLFSRYNRAFLAEAILMFADASGDAVSIERNAMVRKTRSHFVQTNFHQSRSRRAEQDGRYATASTMLDQAGGAISIDLFRRTLAATYQRDSYPTLYSNIYDLRSRKMHLYYFHDFDRAVTFDLAEELRKGARSLDIPALFPRNAAAEAFAGTRRNETRTPAARIAQAATVLAILLGAIGVGWRRGGRVFRIGLAVAVGSVAAAAGLVVAALMLHAATTAPWLEFSIAPATGNTAQVNDTLIRSTGMTLRSAIATAYGVPSVRVIGPPWIASTRYSINAVAGVDSAESMPSLLRQELERRFQLKTHVEPRPFEVFVLASTAAPRLDPARGASRGIRFDRDRVSLRSATPAMLASALQLVLERPVIDETGLTGTFDIDFGVDADPVRSLPQVLQDRFGLRLSQGHREMDALILDSIHRDPALLLLAGAGRLSRGAPAEVRAQISKILTVR